MTEAKDALATKLLARYARKIRPKVREECAVVVFHDPKPSLDVAFRIPYSALSAIVSRPEDEVRSPGKTKRFEMMTVYGHTPEEDRTYQVAARTFRATLGACQDSNFERFGLHHTTRNGSPSLLARLSRNLPGHFGRSGFGQR